MKNIKNWIYLTSILLLVVACKKSEFLKKKPSTEIIQPVTLADFRQILDNTDIISNTSGLAQASADDNDISFANYQIASATERNAYIWNKEIYGGDIAISDWNANYQEIFYSNTVLEGLIKSDSANTVSGQYIKGWALFTRAFAFYDLTRTFCKSYDASSAGTDLGIPLRLSSSIDYLQSRSTLQQSFDQILADLNTCIPLLPDSRPAANLNRPSKIAAYALLARIYLDMRNYIEAEKNADLSLNLYSTLIDYNTVSKTSTTPFSTTNAELIYNKVQSPVYARLTLTGNASPAKISSSLIALYDGNDLRSKVYFGALADGTYYKKRGYSGVGLYHFTGLATDELFLIKAECLARKGQVIPAMEKLNQLIIKRFDNTKSYISITANSLTEAVDKIILERRKELVWRGLRWYDLKRLNKEGANITLNRTLNGVTYTLLPNDPKYVFPIPDDEIALSGIQQNIR